MFIVHTDCNNFTFCDVFTLIVTFKQVMVMFHYAPSAEKLKFNLIEGNKFREFLLPAHVCIERFS